MHLVYIQTTIGVQAQKVPKLVPGPHGQAYLATHELPPHQCAWPIDALASKYPEPKQEQGNE